MLVILLIGGFREHMYYTEEQIEKVRSGSDIVQIIGRYVNLKRSGSGYVGTTGGISIFAFFNNS